MRILVFGAGAIGSVFGGFLSRHHEVTFLGRPDYLRMIQKRGLTISGIWGRHHFSKFECFSGIQKILRKKKTFDLILLTVKSFDTQAAARVIRKIINSRTIVLSLQNGVENVDALHRFLPKHQVLAGRVIFGAQRSKTGCRVTVSAESTAIGETAVHKITPRVRQIAGMFSKSGIPSIPASNIRSVLWRKIAYNCALNPLASLLETHYGYLGEHSWTRSVMEEAVGEVYQVAAKLKIRMKPADAAGYMKLFYSKLLPMTYNHHPSMLQDLRSKRKTEIDSLSGAIVRIGKKLRVDTPVNRRLAQWIHQKEKKNRA